MKRAVLLSAVCIAVVVLARPASANSTARYALIGPGEDQVYTFRYAYSAAATQVTTGTDGLLQGTCAFIPDNHTVVDNLPDRVEANCWFERVDGFYYGQFQVDQASVFGATAVGFHQPTSGERLRLCIQALVWWERTLDPEPYRGPIRCSEIF